MEMTIPTSRARSNVLVLLQFQAIPEIISRRIQAGILPREPGLQSSYTKSQSKRAHL